MTNSLMINPWGGLRVPDIRHAEAAECGLACLAMIAGYHGRQMDLATLRRRHPISVRGASLRDVQDYAGHKDPRTTRRYDHSRDSLDRNAAYTVAAYLA